MPGKPRFGRSAGNLKSLSRKRSQKIQKGNSWASKEPQRKKQNYRPTPPCSFVVFLVTAVPPAEASRLGTLTLLRAAGRPSEAFILLWHHTGHHMTLVSSVQQCRGLWEERQTFCTPVSCFTQGSLFLTVCASKNQEICLKVEVLPKSSINSIWSSDQCQPSTFLCR